MKRPEWLTKEVLGWAMFDFANQAFTMVMITTMYQMYFIQHIVPRGEDGGTEPGKRLWEVSNIIGEIAIIVSAPLMGAIADFSGAKKKFLFMTYAGCVLFTLALGFVGPGHAVSAMTIYIVAYYFFGTGENFLNAFLPEIANHRDMGRVSAFSWTIAYSGALISMGVAVLIMNLLGEPAGYRWISVWSGLFFLFAAIPTFVWLKERKLAEQLPPDQTMLTIGFHRLQQTFVEVKRFKQLFRFLLIVLVYISGMQVVIFYAGIITKEMFHFDTAKQGLFMCQIIVTGIIGAAITGRVQDRIGTRTTIQILLLLWSATLLAAALVRPEWEWLIWMIGNLVGLSMGALGTASRVMAGLFSPHHKAGEFFGFYGMAHKGSVILALAAQFVLGTMGAPFNVAIGASAGFFVAGFFLMFTIDERRGRIVAIKAAREHVRKHKDYAGKISGDVT